MNTAGLAVQPLNTQEMLDLSGGMEELIAPSRDSGFWYDVMWCAGRVAAGAIYLLTADRPPSPYTYAKVGYTN